MNFTPKRRRKMVGIEYTNNGFRISVVTPHAGDVHLLATEDVSFGEESKEPEGPHGPVEAVKEIVNRHKLKGAYSVLSATNSSALVRCLRLPKVPDKALRQMVEVNIGTTIHLPFEDPMFDVSPLSDIPESDEQIVCLVATPRNQVQELSTFVKNVGLRPVAIEVPALALWRVYQRHDGATTAGLSLLVDIDKDEICLSLFVEDKLYFSRTIQMEMDGVRMNLPSVASDVANEIDRVVNFFNFNLMNQTQTLRRVVLHSKIDHPGEFASELGSRLNCELCLLQTLVRTRKSDAGVHPRYYTAIGLALREKF